VSKALARAWERLRLLVGLLVVAGFLFFMPARFTAPARVLFNEAAGPLETVLFQGGGDVLAAGGTLSEMFRRQDAARALAAEIRRLRNRNAALADELSRRDALLRSIRGLDVKELEVRALRAPVSSYDATAVHQSITVRAGARDGVAAGMAVAAEGALVGLVVEAGPTESRVRLITDPGSAVPCRLSRTRELCILQGTGAESCRVDWLRHDSLVQPGDVLVTASLAARGVNALLVPDGLPAATVTTAGADSMRPLFMAVLAAPRVNLARLEAVEVLIPLMEGRPAGRHGRPERAGPLSGPSGRSST